MNTYYRTPSLIKCRFLQNLNFNSQIFDIQILQLKIKN
ncbi:hypothetical protein MmTuc01_3203 [Methanosarcina mazei Tuc01]|uniref:Uncharacterized protein n=1 Tax=Methanosarcina mazei Tuc01 TaxID=1236903 RepID=M1Q825_METMZ|nr:hypothetical protein MmTuc01_3203 [Methanosarcina mazei Tuc01]